MSTDSYYKTIGYAGLLIDQTGELNQYTSLNLSLTFLSLHYPRNLMKHLPPEENLYLHCLADRLQDDWLANQLAEDYGEHKDQEIYIRYLHQLTTANIKKEGGELPMVCEGLLNLCGTSSEEIIARTKKEADEYYQPKINQLSSQNEKLSSQNDNLSSQITYLKSLLTQHNIPYNLESKTNDC